MTFKSKPLMCVLGGSKFSCPLLVAQVSLYCWDKDERRLLEYLQSARDSLGKPWYEPQFALRVARQHGRLNACVRLLCELGLHEVSIILYADILRILLCLS